MSHLKLKYTPRGGRHRSVFWGVGRPAEAVVNVRRTVEMSTMVYFTFK